MFVSDSNESIIVSRGRGWGLREAVQDARRLGSPGMQMPVPDRLQRGVLALADSGLRPTTLSVRRSTCFDRCRHNDRKTAMSLAFLARFGPEHGLHPLGDSWVALFLPGAPESFEGTLTGNILTENIAPRLHCLCRISIGINHMSRCYRESDGVNECCDESPRTDNRVGRANSSGRNMKYFTYDVRTCRSVDPIA